MHGLYDQVCEAADAIRARWPGRARVGIVLGSGLGAIADEIADPAVMTYESIPHLPSSTVIGHAGRLVCGELEGVEVVVMQGRFHCYEGYSQRQVTLPIRVMKALGAEVLITTNASGGLNPLFREGEVMALDDHINLMWDNPLIGVNDDRLGPRFPDMSRPYDPQLIDIAERIAQHENFVLRRGVYLGVAGPNYEPRSEYRFMRRIGADVVGMSTVPETLVAVHAAMRVLGLSIVSNVCIPDALKKTTGEEVVDVCRRAAAKVELIVRGVLRQMREQEQCATTLQS